MAVLKKPKTIQKRRILLVPDLLGYGGTDKPTDPKLYFGSGHAQDIVDILDAEGLDQVIAIGHNWGSGAVSRLINYYPQRVSACAFLTVGYFPPTINKADLITRSRGAVEVFGYDLFAYMPAVIEKHIDSFISVFFPASPQMWKDILCTDGGTRAWLEGNETTSLPSYMSQEADKEELDGGFWSDGHQ
ncbi:Alpha/Beta hydrolase protein [Mycena alexandri]|uniref:Alpha/Beta hydrolase protein n=1 Tax=Mycena alexandri TaxID=1745969 RepID=A0AAD6WTQ5_9AGAR|nr:Alpha/Beta hydrolase protein [Mycena alexandri]